MYVANRLKRFFNEVHTKLSLKPDYTAVTIRYNYHFMYSKDEQKTANLL